MTSSNFAFFAPYTPPPDDPSYTYHVRPSFPTHASSSRISEPSYQSGGIPTFGVSPSEFGTTQASQEQQNPWETRFGARVDLLASATYVLGPVSALLLLVLETRNDYVRFHAYQSALLTTPLVMLRIFMSLVQAPPWMRAFCTFLIVFLQLGMAIRAYLDVTQNGLTHSHLPAIGLLAEHWLADE